MTTPAQPDTGAGAEPDTGSAPNTTTTSEVDQSATGDWTELIQQFEADGLVPNQVTERLKASRKHEQRAKTNKQQLDELLAKQQGGPSLEDLQARAEAAEERAAELAYANTVNGVASRSGLNGAELRDSGRFQAKVAEELGDDFDDDDLLAAVEKVAKTKEFAGNPRFADSKAPARSGADITGGPGTPRQVTEDELSRMSPEQIVEAQDKGLLKSLLGG